MAVELRDMEKRVEELNDMGEKQKARVLYYYTKIQTITFAFLAWERFFFFAISRSSLTCNTWSPTFAINSLCTFPFLLLFLDAVLMLHRAEHQLNIIYKKQAELYRKIRTVREEAMAMGPLMETGDGSGSDGLESWDTTRIVNSKQGGGRRQSVERKVYISAIFSALVGVAALELYDCMSLLCN